MSPYPARPLEGNEVDLFLLKSGLPQSGDPGLSGLMCQGMLMKEGAKIYLCLLGDLSCEPGL